MRKPAALEAFHRLLLSTLLLSALPGSGKADQPKTEPIPEALFEELPIVEAAALHAQTLDEAPANVTIITAAEIRKYGYRTLGEALASVRGFYGVDDRYYQYFGVRGLNLPGDYNTRFLVMLNGHPMTENVYSSNGFFGQDFGLDMDLVERIEVIRGPTSALYGSNGMLANINIVTRSPVSQERGRLSTETDSLGQRKVIASTSVDLGKGRNLLVSGSVLNSRGQSFLIPGYAAPETRLGRTTRSNDRERGYHTFANLLLGRWNVVGYVSSRQKNNAVPWGGDSPFDDPASWILDQRNFVAAMYSRDTGKNGKLRWQTYFDQYRYRDLYAYGVEDDRTEYGELAWGDWFSSQLTYQFPVGWLGALTIGASGSVDLRNRQVTRQHQPEEAEANRIDAPDRQGAAFAQIERKLGRKWTAHLGARLDLSANYGSAWSPRVAMVYQASPRTSWKFVYGRPFRNPSAYEKYWSDGVYLVPPLGLKQETATTLEAVLERRLRKSLTGVVNVYHYRLGDLIQTELVGAAYRYRNFAASDATGVEGELQGSMTRRLGWHGSWAFQRTRDRDTGWLVNSPRHVAKARAAYELVPRKLTLSGALYALSGRRTAFGGEVGAVRLFDVTLSTLRLTSHFDMVTGLRNAFDARYLHPVAIAVDRMPGEGRSLFVKMIVRTSE